MRYRNMAAAIDWLCTAFGFEEHHVFTGEDGAILHAQLTLRSDMIMLLAVRTSDIDRLMKQPDEIGGAETQSCYFVVEDADIHCDKAKAAGAGIVLNIKEYDHGGRGYSCRDPEGHLWTFGTYDPWQTGMPSLRGKRNPRLLVPATVATAIAVATAAWMLVALPQPAPSGEEKRPSLEPIAARDQGVETTERAVRQAEDAANRAAQETREQLARAQSAKEIAERNAGNLQKQLSEERLAKEIAERTANSASEQIARERTAKEEAQRIISDTREELMRKQRAAHEASEQLAQERSAREVAERAAEEGRKRPAEVNKAERSDVQPAKSVDALNRRAQQLYDAGKYAEVIEPAEQYVALAKSLYGEDHLRYAIAIRWLATLYSAQGRIAEAEPLYQRALAITEKTLRPNHLEVGTTLDKLAALYQIQARYAEAEPLYKRTLTIYEKVFGPEHLLVGTSLNNLAALYSAQGRIAEAEPLYQRALAIAASRAAKRPE